MKDTLHGAVWFGCDIVVIAGEAEAWSFLFCIFKPVSLYVRAFDVHFFILVSVLPVIYHVIPWLVHHKVWSSFVVRS